jgi:hypothetical protein
VLINGNGIVANNSIDLMVGFDPSAAAQGLNVQNALSMLNSLGY